MGHGVGFGRTDCDGCGSVELSGTLTDSSTCSLSGVGAFAAACRVLERPRHCTAKCVLVHYINNKSKFQVQPLTQYNLA